MTAWAHMKQCEMLVKVTQRLLAGHSVSSVYLREQYGLSRATAYRYMILLETLLPVCAEEHKATGRGRAPRRIWIEKPQLLRLLRAEAA